MLNNYVTVNINRNAKIQHRYCPLKQLLLCYCQGIAETIERVFNPIQEAIVGMIYRPFWMAHQRNYLLSCITLLLHQIDNHPSCIYDLLNS